MLRAGPAPRFLVQSRRLRARTNILTSFCREGGRGDCGPARTHSTLSHPQCARPAPLPLCLDSLRKQRELWFLRNCAVAFATRLLEAQTSRGWWRRWGVPAGLGFTWAWCASWWAISYRVTLGKSRHLSKPLLMAVKPHENDIVIEKQPRADFLFSNSADLQHSLAKAQMGGFFKLHQGKARPISGLFIGMPHCACQVGTLKVIRGPGGRLRESEPRDLCPAASSLCA